MRTEAAWEKYTACLFAFAGSAKWKRIILFSCVGLLFANRAYGQAPAITSANNTTFTGGTSGSFTVTATGSPTPTLSESGTLPSGVTFNSGTGVLSGTPPSGAPGTYSIVFTAQNGAPPANSFVQKTDRYFYNYVKATSESLTFGSNVGTGHLVFCTLGWETPDNTLISSVTDTIGNTYTALPLLTNDSHESQGFYTFSSGSGSDTVTASYTGAGAGYVGMACGEWSGPTHIDVHAEAIGDSNMPTSAPVTPLASGELLIGYGDNSGSTWSATGGWTLRSSNSSNIREGLEDQLSSGSGPIASGLSTTNSEIWQSGIVAFSGASAAVQNFTLTVQNPMSQAPQITSANNTAFTLGSAGSFTVTATGSPIPTLSSSGALPTGVTFNSGTGVLSGTPAAGSAVTYPVTFTAQNSLANAFIQKTDRYFYNNAKATSESLAFGSNVVAGDLVFCTLGWETFDSTLISSVTDTIGNTYTALPLLTNDSHESQGFYTFSTGSGSDTVTAHYTGAGASYVGMACGEWFGPTHIDVHGEAVGNSNTPTSSSVTPLASGELLIGYGDNSGSTWSATGGWTLRSSSSSNIREALEDQLSSGSGPIASGLSTTNSEIWQSGIAAFSGASSSVQSFTLTVHQPPAITSANNATFAVAAAGSFTVTATGSPTPTISESGALPNGVTFNSGTGALAGTPASGTTGTYPITLTASNGVGSNATQSFTLTVDQVGLSSITTTPTSVTGGTLLTGTVTLSAAAPSGGAQVVVSVDNDRAALAYSAVTPTSNIVIVPSGSTSTNFDIQTALVSTVTPVMVTGVYNGTQSSALTVNPPSSLTFVNGSELTQGYQGGFYFHTLQVLGGTPPYTFTLQSGSLPTGVTLATDGLLSGFSTVSGNSSFSIRVTDNGTPTGSLTQQFGLSIATACNCNASIYPNTEVPLVADSLQTTPGEFGVRFHADSDGNIIGIRFYKGASNTGTHVGNLWSASGQNLATATFTGETSSGWQEVDFSSPVHVTANTDYVASYYSPTGDYSSTQSYYGIGVGSDHAPLHVPADSSATPNGVYTFGGTSSFPTSVLQSSNYYVDVVYSPTVGPAITSVSVNPTSVTGGTTSTGTITLNEAAPTGGETVNLTSTNSTAASVPSSVTVAAGSMTATFTVTTTTVAQSTAVTITGYGNGAQTAVVTVVP